MLGERRSLESVGASQASQREVGQRCVERQVSLGISLGDCTAGSRRVQGVEDDEQTKAVIEHPATMANEVAIPTTRQLAHQPFSRGSSLHHPLSHPLSSRACLVAEEKEFESEHEVEAEADAEGSSSMYQHLPTVITEQNVVKIEEYAECLLLARQIDDMEENEAHAQSKAVKLIQDARETEKRHQ